MTLTTTDAELTPDLLDRVAKLSPASKEHLLDLLTAELDGPPDDLEVVRREQRELIAQRIADIAAGRVQLIDAEEGLARLEAKYGKAPE